MARVPGRSTKNLNDDDDDHNDVYAAAKVGGGGGGGGGTCHASNAETMYFSGLL